MEKNCEGVITFLYVVKVVPPKDLGRDVYPNTIHWKHVLCQHYALKI